MTITSDVIEHQLARCGYALVRRSAEHSLYEHDGDRVVVPQPPAELTPWTARAIEWSLEPRLGRRWLSTPPTSRTTSVGVGTAGVRPTRQLTLAIRRAPDRGMWNAFVVEEPRILTCAATLAEIRRRAADAAGVWFADDASVRLEPCLHLDAATRGWVEHAAGDARTPDRLVEARQHLRLLGLSPDDVAELLDGSTVGDGRR